MSRTRGGRLRSVSAVIGLTLALCAPAAESSAYGSLNVFGQHAEHERITRQIGQDDPRWEPNSMSLLAGRQDNMGGVAAPDRPMDSGGITKGSGPGYKHCDDGDYLDTPGYPQSKDAARAALESCARYYQTLMGRAVRYSGKLVSADLVVDRSVFRMTEGVSPTDFAPNDLCVYRFSLEADNNAKCDVMNALGRALHVAEDVYSHTNWADLADPSKPIGTDNPPGLGMTTVPGFLRYPADPVIPDGLISGCDDTPSGTENCDNRVKHSTLAKDNGFIDFPWGTAEPTDKYPRGIVTVGGDTNFHRSVHAARMQATSTWRDFEAAVMAKYGPDRGALIIQAIVKDAPPTAAAVAMEASAEASGAASAVASPEASATEGTPAPAASGSVEASSVASPMASASGMRMAAGGEEGNAVPAASASTGLPTGVLLVIVLLLVLVAVIVIVLRRRSSHGQQSH